MYIITLYNGDMETRIHDDHEKLTAGKITKGINTINSFAFSLLPDNPGFYQIREFVTLVTAYNVNKGRFDFVGRVLYAETSMDENGMIEKSVTCESIAGYLCDSAQYYIPEQNWTVSGLLRHLIDCHNSMVEEYKHFKIGTVSVTDKNDNVYIGIQVESTWNALKSKLIDKLGGELQFRIEGDGIYIDYLTRIGGDKSTVIAMSDNMKSITREQDPTAFVTRLIPLGCKLKDENGEETETRLDISAVNGGVKYIDDEQAIAYYGVHVGTVEFDDVTDAGNLLEKGRAWFDENNKVQVKYSITALDLSLLGYDYDDFDIGNTHPIENALLGIDDTARIIKQIIDVCDETESTIEVGDNFKSLSDIQRDNTAQIVSAEKLLNNVQTQTNAALKQITQQKEEFNSLFEQFTDSMKLEVSGTLGSKASIILSAGKNEYSGEMDLSQIRKAFADDKTAISISSGLITFNAGTLVINSENFTVDASGVITAKSGTIGGWTLKSYKLYAGDGVDIKTVCVQAPTENNLYVFAAGGTSHDSYADCPFRVTKAGKLYASDAIISGEVTTVSGKYKTELNSGSLELYYDGKQCGTINTKYWSGASTEGVSLRIEEAGKYIMFSHPSSAGSGYDVDYYLNYGWSSNYDEKHIFQTSARFMSDVYLDGKTDIGSLRLRGAGGKRYLVTANDNGSVTCSIL